MPDPIIAPDRVPLHKLEQQVRAAFARDGAAVMYATKRGYRNLRRLRAQLRGAQPPDCGWSVNLYQFDADDGGGALVVRHVGSTYPAVPWREAPDPDADA